MKDSPKIQPASGKLGVLTPGFGAVATTFVAGVEAVQKGLAKPFGSVTQMQTIRLGKRTEGRSPLVKDFVPLAPLDNLVFGAWDPIPDNAYESALNAGVLDKHELLAPMKGFLEKLEPMPAAFDSHYVKKLTGKPTRVLNDAGVQGHGVIEGKGVEMCITLGTGFGCALFVDGRYVPNLELAHHPFRKDRTYEEYVGAEALDKVGKKKWNKRVARVISQLEPRSIPSGFSSPMRAPALASPTLSSPRIVGSNRLGAVERKIASRSAAPLPPTLRPSAAKLSGSVTSSGW